MTAQSETLEHVDLCSVADLRAALVREAALLREKDIWVQQQSILNRESDHRLLNNLQMVASMLAMQGRMSENADVASALMLAANRVATIGRIHRHLHSNAGLRSVAFKRFIEELSGDFTAMLSAETNGARIIAFEGVELELPSAIGVSLGFVVNELIINALKYGDGPITVRLWPDPRKGFVLSVEDQGPGLPDGFSAMESKGLGMRIIRSFLARIGGELCISRGDGGRGARFTILFSVASSKDGQQGVAT